jgi:hypothetical protein
MKKGAAAIGVLDPFSDADGLDARAHSHRRTVSFS